MRSYYSCQGKQAIRPCVFATLRLGYMQVSDACCSSRMSRRRDLSSAGKESVRRGGSSTESVARVQGSSSTTTATPDPNAVVGRHRDNAYPDLSSVDTMTRRRAMHEEND